MLEIALFTALIAAAALFLQQKVGVPTPITIIAAIVGISLSGYQPFKVTDDQFDHLVYLALPVLICGDALVLRWDELKKSALALFFLAGVGIVLSVGAAIALNHVILPAYPLSIAAVAALYCMILATDPVSVAAVFGKAHLPHGLKVLAEGESLFNDATALIVFSIALVFMGHGSEHVAQSPLLFGFKTVFGALAIGFAVGYVGLMVLRLVSDAMTETMIILSMALSAFWLAEHYHVSGILAVIVAILFANQVITKHLHLSNLEINKPTVSRKTLRSMLLGFEHNIVGSTVYQVVVSNIQFIAILAATVLFMSMANLINLALLGRYWLEILAVFLGSTAIRMVMMGLLSLLGRKVPGIPTISFHWWQVLTAAGVKGALSLVMLHMIPRDFQYRELFEAIVVGNVVLTTFLYPLALILILKVYREKFEEEYAAEHQVEE